jgi:hypothetical protein
VNPMQCVQCGAQVLPGQVFCSKCGQPVSGAAPSPSTAGQAPSLPSSPGQTTAPSPSAGFSRSSRVARHLSVLAILWIVYSGLRLIPGVLMMAFGHMVFPFLLMSFPGPLRALLGPFVTVLGLIFSGFAVAGLIAGIGLMTRSPWARILAIVLGCINLIHIPFGTALGVYTLWVLVPQDAAVEYQRLAGRG